MSLDCVTFFFFFELRSEKLKGFQRVLRQLTPVFSGIQMQSDQSGHMLIPGADKIVQTSRTKRSTLRFFNSYKVKFAEAFQRKQNDNLLIIFFSAHAWPKQTKNMFTSLQTLTKSTCNLVHFLKVSSHSLIMWTSQPFPPSAQIISKLNFASTVSLGFS